MQSMWGVHEEFADFRIPLYHIFEDSAQRVSIVEDFTLISVLIVEKKISISDKSTKLRIYNFQILIFKPSKSLERNP